MLGINVMAMNFDEFICFYFLKIHKLRRIAELKLFEFLVSLRHYSKTYSRATSFAYMASILRYPVPQGEQSYIYKFDIFA